jgi:small G protein signaling modulator 3
VFFVEGSTYMFRVALAIIKINEKGVLGCKSPAGVYSFMKEMMGRTLPIERVVGTAGEMENRVREETIEEMREVEVAELKREMSEFY